ncbi:hypothetical protein [Comamonas odontotermitis]|uniref:hypothetical protein n=1 Tax=Comamonas odontotermitis TaxID=379895 RepID=UPI001CC597EC|nr:hypothetical protein [Comamonas odontotermitis]UBB17869.1 hypothetical protein LAD35_04255 [Comamonas odontotermitis]
MKRKYHWGWDIALSLVLVALLFAGVPGVLLGILGLGVVTFQLLAAILTGKQSNDGMR